MGPVPVKVVGVVGHVRHWGPASDDQAQVCRYWNIKALLAHGADPSIRNNRGRTALEPDYIAVNDPNCAICRRLLQEAVSGPPSSNGEAGAHHLRQTSSVASSH